MFKVTVKRAFAALAVTAGLLAEAPPAGALVLYDGHARSASVYQHNQTDLEFLSVAAGTDHRRNLEHAADRDRRAALTRA